MENPFKYGVEVTGDDFVDREKELRELKSETLSGKSVVLYSPRRMGKTSLLAELFRRLRGTALTVHVKLYGIKSKEAFAEKIVSKTISATYTRVDKIFRVGTLLRGLKADLVLTPEGEIQVRFARQVQPKDLEEVFEFPEKVAGKKGKKMIVAFDEFQEVGHLNGIEIEKLAKATFERHKHVAYVFAGSKRHLLHEIFADESRPLFKFARPMELGNIPSGDFRKFIIRKFEDSGGNIAEGVVDGVLRFTRGHPYFTQQLCHELWDLSRNVDDEAMVKKAIEVVLSHYNVEYEGIWDRLKSTSQRNLLVGLAMEPEANIYSSAFIEKFQLKTSAHVRKAIEKLEERGLIERGEISDIFFKEWLKTRFG